ncbi:hypothetical protein SDJN03_25909, partial [Cucurbita argyrosperma subsp. sororia]
MVLIFTAIHDACQMMRPVFVALIVISVLLFLWLCVDCKHRKTAEELLRVAPSRRWKVKGEEGNPQSSNTETQNPISQRLKTHSQGLCFTKAERSNQHEKKANGGGMND